MASQSPIDASSTGDDAAASQPHIPLARRQSSSQDSHTSEDSHTALDIIRSQMQLEADAREALPYSIEHCTKPLGRLRQSVFACLTCNPPPADPAATYDRAAGVCYACSVQCHGEHTLVELFNKRNFVCDCGTTRFPDTSPCSLRIDPRTNTKGNIRGEAADQGNQYNQNFRNRFCGCACDYDPFQQKGTMFQCLGLGTHATGGCGEDWWHPGCVVGLGPRWFEKMKSEKKTDAKATNGSADALPTISEDAEEAPHANGNGDDKEDEDEDEPPMPPGFPKEDDFEGFICYKCIDAYPWIRQYAGAPGFLPAVYYKRDEEEVDGAPAAAAETTEPASRKRKADDGDGERDADAASQDSKRLRADDDEAQQEGKPKDGEVKQAYGTAAPAPAECKRMARPPPPPGQFSLFFTEGFRDQLCRCDACFPLLTPHPQLLEEEETYEPPVSDDGSENPENGHGGSQNGSGGARSHGSGSLYERGESALRNIDRVRALEGVMAYNHLKDKLTPFFRQFAESGQAISAEDIKAYFAQLRGDEQAIREAGEAAARDRSGGRGGGGGGDDNRREQSGY